MIVRQAGCFSLSLENELKTKYKLSSGLFGNVKMSADFQPCLCACVRSLHLVCECTLGVCVCVCVIRRKKITENLRYRETVRLRVEAADPFVPDQS